MDRYSNGRMWDEYDKALSRTSISTVGSVRRCQCASFVAGPSPITVFRAPTIGSNYDIYEFKYTTTNWAIGGKRRTVVGGQSSKIFSSDAIHRWIIRFINNGTAYGPITMNVGGTYSGSPVGSIMFEGRNGTSTGRVLIQHTGTPFEAGLGSSSIVFRKVKFRATSSGHAFNCLSRQGAFIFDDCEFQSAGINMDGFHFQPTGAASQIGNSVRLQFRRCYFHDCSGYGFNRETLANEVTSHVLQVYNCFFKACSLGAIRGVRLRDVTVWSSILKDCAVNGSAIIDMVGSEGGLLRIISNTFDCLGRSKHAIYVRSAVGKNQLLVLSNIFYRFGTTVINAGAEGTFEDDTLAIIDYNCYPSTVSLVQGEYAGSHNFQEDDPGFADPANDDYYLADSTKLNQGEAKPKWPDKIGVYSSTRSFGDVGASQRLPSGIPIIRLEKHHR